jgi:hypothetical protein
MTLSRKFEDRIEIDDSTYYFADDVVNPDEYIANGGFNPHHIRPWLIGNEFGVLGIVYASHEQDAMDELADAGKLDGHLVKMEETTVGENGETLDDCGAELTHLGNAGEPFNIDNVWMRELPNKQYAKIKRHFIAMSGDHGCIPDYCDVFPEYQAAVDSLADMFSLGRTRKARLFAGCILELTPNFNEDSFGAEYCEIQTCDCDNPGKHSDSGIDLDDYLVR